jgi:hypothetical protein
MAWANPRTWSVGEVVTAAIQNAHIRDLFRYLKGLDGVPTIESGLIIDNTDGDEYLKLPLLSTAEAATVLAAEGQVAFDEQTHAPKYYNGSAVKQVNLLSDCEIASEAAGDILYRGASNWSRLAKGSANYYLRMDGAGSYPAWAAGAFQSQIVSGSRASGSGSGDLGITGAGFAPIAVIINAYCTDPGAGSTLIFTSNGHGDSDALEACRHEYYIAGALTTAGIDTSNIIYCVSGVYGWSATLKTMDADGCTITITMAGSTTGTLYYECLFLG